MPRTWPSAPRAGADAARSNGQPPIAIRRMAREVEHMLKDALDAYIQRDAELART
jgi:phosphate uptake regulator